MVSPRGGESEGVRYALSVRPVMRDDNSRGTKRANRDQRGRDAVQYGDGYPGSSSPAAGASFAPYRRLDHRFHIGHATVQVETGHEHDCSLHEAHGHG